jgi:hypothetical protein
LGVPGQVLSLRIERVLAVLPELGGHPPWEMGP